MGTDQGQTGANKFGRRGFNRRFLFGSAAAAIGVTSMSAAAPPPKAVTAAKGKVARAKNETRRMSLYIEKLDDGQMGYGLEKGKASIPGPLIELVEGDTLHIEVENTMDVAASLHVHGVDYEITSDGTRMNNSHIEPGEKRTYTWRTHKPGERADGTWREGSAGYWNYHDHVVGTDHGTGGIRNGLYGPLVVRREGDPLPDKTFTVVFNDMLTNNKKQAPDFEATVGERLEIVSITHSELYHTFHVHGHRWADNRTGILNGPDDPSRIIDTKICGPAESFGFQILAGEGVGAGAWMYHCHVQSHSDMGMAGHLLIAKEDGTIPGWDPDNPDHPHGAGAKKEQGGTDKASSDKATGGSSDDGGHAHMHH
ncbi:multicopper oxidase domain-containing protein [Streptomyces sp. XM4193]|uniref:multicopper oxidase domain-containing protein n=1 Tax=Streptomyces sp. XM4193 TaxID=2929782 RepID=UPI001FFB82C8|nr:multicopper oxidase domain-containing protein [Streptomyces sp. XM4193]MCK1794817.1 multicopper oxidase domain-containing protein [Streptomyces sp. XM4193]